MRLQALILDMDGLMVDSERLYFAAEHEMATHFNKKIRDEELWPMMGRKPIEGMRLFRDLLGVETSVEEMLEWRDRLMREKMRHELQPMPGVKEIVAAFRGRLKLAVATAAQQEYLDRVLDYLEMHDAFDVLQTADGLEFGKPDPSIYRVTCRRLGLSEGECLVLEDAANGVLAAKAAGCRVIAVPNVYTQGQDFSVADWIEPDLFAAGRRVEAMME